MVSIKTIFHYFLFSYFLIMKKTHTQSFTLLADLSLISADCANQYYVISFYRWERIVVQSLAIGDANQRWQTLIKFGNSEDISYIGIISSRFLTSSYLHCIRTCISAVHIFLYVFLIGRRKQEACFRRHFCGLSGKKCP